MNPYNILLTIAVVLKICFLILAILYHLELSKKNTAKANTLLHYKDIVELLFQTSICIILIINFRPNHTTYTVDKLTAFLIFVYACITMILTPWTNLPIVKKIQEYIGGYSDKDYALFNTSGQSSKQTQQKQTNYTSQDISGVVIDKGYLTVTHN